MLQLHDLYDQISKIGHGGGEGGGGLFEGPFFSINPKNRLALLSNVPLYSVTLVN